MKKKQDIIFMGIGKDNKNFTTSSLEVIATHSNYDPIPLNRKSRRALPKMLKKFLKGVEQNERAN